MKFGLHLISVTELLTPLEFSKQQEQWEHLLLVFGFLFSVLENSCRDTGERNVVIHNKPFHPHLSL